MAGASADKPMTAAQVAAGSARQALASAVRRSLTRPGSVPPSEQHRLITAERQAERACAEVLEPRSPRRGERVPDLCRSGLQRHVHRWSTVR